MKSSTKRELLAVAWFLVSLFLLHTALVLVHCFAFGPWGAVLESVDDENIHMWRAIGSWVLFVFEIVAAVLITKRIMRSYPPQ